jgi:hypothetical protein
MFTSAYVGEVVCSLSTRCLHALANKKRQAASLNWFICLFASSHLMVLSLSTSSYQTEVKTMHYV